MAEIKPIRGWRYADSLDIDELTSPLFDVVSDKQREVLYRNPLNSIQLSVPQGPHAADRAAALLMQWKKEKVIVQDKLPAIYVYYQYFRVPGSSIEHCRKGFVAHIRTYDWEDKVILRHENTIPQSVNDRTELLRKTQLHVSATHGLYTDPSFSLEKWMDESIQYPIYETEDYQGVRDVFSVIQDAKVMQYFIDVLHDKKIILADGHHRYEGSLAYKHACIREHPDHQGDEGYHFHLMYLTNTEAGDLRILPTHRLIHGLENFNEEEMLEKLRKDFILKPIEDPDTLNEVILGKQWTFGLIFRDHAWKVRLKPDVHGTMPWHFPDVIKSLDLTVMHYFIIEKALGIAGKNQRTSPHVDFDRSFGECLRKVSGGQAQLAIITREVSIEDVKRVCESGSTMPQKSTYFYPKVICGFLFSSIKENEFQPPYYSRF